MPGRNSRCTFSQTPLSPTWEKSGKLTPPPEKFFQHVSHHLMSKNELFGNLFRIVISNCSARVSIVIDHPCAPPPVSGSILSAVPLCKNRGRMETLFKNFLINSVQHRLQRVLSSYGQRAFHLPLHIYMAKISDFGNA